MKISNLYVYPVKSLRAHSLDSAEVTRHGFKYDRRFMILQVVQGDDGSPSYKNMHVADYSEMVLFLTALHPPSGPTARDGTISITFTPPQGDERTLELPLEPETGGLEVIDIVMHLSPAKAYKMDGKYNDWLSSCFGYSVVLAYLGPHHREVLMSTSSNRQPTQSPSWLSTITNTATSFLAPTTAGGEQITFADVAPYLVVSDRSMDDVHNRLPDGELMDITKFRPNIVVTGAREPWEEDFWGQITIGSNTIVDCFHNCARCKSINIDYGTGEPGTTAAGKMLAKLQSNRRVDPGAKYSPVFGRYSFLHPSSEGHIIGLGDEVVVSRENSERTQFGEIQRHCRIGQQFN